jgi:2-iminobutanoate/2-iminopropanoate deaminase
MRNIVLFLLSISSIAVSAQSNIVKLINPPGLSASPNYSHAAEVDLGTCKMVIISGQVALDAQGNLVGQDDFTKQAEQVFQNIKTIVESSGGTMKDVVKYTTFVTDINDVPKLREIRKKYTGDNSPAASTLVEIKELVRKEFLLEIEATAIIPKS